MTVTALTPQPLAKTGTVVTLAAANAGGSTIPASFDNFLVVTNGSGGSINVTISSHAAAPAGTIASDLVVAVGAGVTKYIGPFEPAAYKSSTNLYDIAYSAVTSVTVAAVSLH